MPLACVFTGCFIKKCTSFSFFYNSLKWWSIYLTFLSAVAEEILLQNIWTTYGSWLNIFCWTWCNADVIVCHEYELACLNWWVICYLASIVNLIWFTDEKCSSCQHWATYVGMKSGISRARNSTILQALCAGAVSCSNLSNLYYTHKHINVIALHVFVAATVKLQEFVISKPD